MADLTVLTKPLSVEEIEFRAKQAFENKNGAAALLLAYKNSRTDMNRLDQALGILGWQNTFHRDSKGVLQCSIGLWNDDLKQFIWKTSNGIESDYEKEKGEYSDAFKRAGFACGIGRELYQFPTMIVPMWPQDYYKEGAKIKIKHSFNPNKFKWTIHGDAMKHMKNLTAHRKDASGEWVKMWESNPRFQGWISKERFDKMIGVANDDPDVVRENISNFLLTDSQVEKLNDIIG